MTMGTSDTPATRPNRLPTWANLVLGAWLFISPWVLGMTAGPAWNSWVVGAVIFVVALSAMGRGPALWNGWVNLVLGAWRFVSPWVLGMYAASAWNSWVVGAVVFVLAGIGIAARSRGAGALTHAHGHR